MGKIFLHKELACLIPTLGFLGRFGFVRFLAIRNNEF
jgi:hypothetical protein